MQPVSIYDEIVMDTGEREGITVECGSPNAPGGPSNLAYRAAAIFFIKTGLKPAVKIGVVKNIPVGAGLGGGSSDAATVLMGLNDIYSAGLKEEELIGLASQLGSDVPFFILKGPALASGRGEVLKRAVVPGFNYILVNPGIHVSTAWVYGNLDLTKKSEDNNLTYSEEALTEPIGVKGLLVNDLESVTIKRHPEIIAIKDALIEAGALCSLMSGSGSTVFGVFSGEEAARRAYGLLKQRLDPGYAIFMAVGL